jgi:DGQHR domain-containing protein
MNVLVESPFSEVTEHPTVQAARDAATDLATATGGRVYPCVVFVQGDRLMITTSFPFNFVTSQVKIDSASKGGTIGNSTNRPFISDHARNIQAYLLENKAKYILPPVTLNIRQVPQIHMAKSNAAIRFAFLIVDDSTEFEVTDGQHRIVAITGTNDVRPALPSLISQDKDFMQHGLSVLVVVEPKTGQIHQDFADAAQTKPIPASMLAVYNQREPINRVLNRIAQETPLFNGRLDETSKTLSKNSVAVFLLNQIRMLVKELLFKDYALSDDALNRSSATRIGTVVQQNAFISETSELLDTLTESMNPWKEVNSMPLAGAASTKIPDLRSKYINMTATGLVIIGRVAHEINKKFADHDDRASMYKRLATEIDWERSGKCWQGTIIATGGRMLTNRAPVNLAAQAVMRQLGLIKEFGTAADS